jgi:acyl-coenzyme A thioesterase PaaI-like protein
VEAVFSGGDPYQGYTGILHGGVIAMLLDAAMTNCLFAHGHCGVTAELTVRFRHPVVSSEPSRLRAWMERCSPSLSVLRAELWQSGRCRATALGKFMRLRGEIGGVEPSGKLVQHKAEPNGGSRFSAQGVSYGKPG